MPHHILSLERTNGETKVSLHSDGSLIASHVAGAEIIKSLFNGADGLLDDSARQPTRGDLFSFGRKLATDLLGPIHAPLTALRGRLWIVSKDAELLNIPLELVARAKGEFLIEGGHLMLRRATEMSAATDTTGAKPRPGPLRVLFMVCAPEEEEGNQLAFEIEQEAFESVCIQAGEGVHLDTEFSGTLEGLARKIQSFRPHLVHLVGHASMDDDGIGHFLFEDEFGNDDFVPASQIARTFANFGVSMVFFSGCETARAGIAGVCQAVARSGHIPLVLGWGLSVSDDLAMRFAVVLLTSLAAGESIDIAVDRARAEILNISKGSNKQDKEFLRPEFAMPRLYACGGVETLHDLAAPEERPKTAAFVRRPFEDGITSLVEGFIGRRRILKRTFPVLRDGAKGRRVLLLTGIAGAGKSSLASHIIDQFRTDRAWITVALKLRENESPQDFGARIARTVREKAQLISGFNSLHIQQLGEDSGEKNYLKDLSRRLRSVVQALNDHPFLLYLDNLESLMPLPPAIPVWTDPAFQEFFDTLINRLTGRGRVILTCRYMPHGLTAEKAPHLLHEQMPDFSFAEFNRYLLYDETIRHRILRGDLNEDLLRDFHAKLGATPRFLDQIKVILRNSPADAIRNSLSRIEVNAIAQDHADTSDEILKIQQHYLEELFLPGLYQALSPDHRQALSRFAVSDFALPLDGLANMVGLSEAEAQKAQEAWHSLGLVQILDGRTGPSHFSIYSLQRAFLTTPDKLPPEDKRRCHRSLASWLKAYHRHSPANATSLQRKVDDLCLQHAISGKDYNLAGWAANRIGGGMLARSEFREAHELAARLIESYRHPEFLKLGADALSHLGKWPEARDLLNEAARGYAAMGDSTGEATTWHALANIDLKEANRDAAQENFGKALEIRKANGDRAGEAAAWHGLGTIHLRKEEFLDAREKFTTALEIRRLVDDRAGEAATLHQIATTDLREEKYTDARKNFRKALKITTKIGDRAGEAAAWNQLALINFQHGNDTSARKKYLRALTINQVIGARAGVAASLHGLGTIDLRKQRYPAAREHFGKALEIRQNIREPIGEATTWMQLAVLSRSQFGISVTNLHLAVVAWDIYKRVNSTKQQAAYDCVSEMADDLKLTPQSLETEIKAALTSYQADRGAALLAAAFPS